MMVSLNGQLVHADQSRISPFDHGLTVGDGVFETLRSYGGVPFAWRRHMERLSASAAALHLQIPAPDDLREGVEAVLAANDLTDARVRITITGGPSPLGSARGEGPATVLLAVEPLDAIEPAIAVAIVPWPRNERSALAGVKSISYAENVRALGWAAERGAGEAIFPNLAGHLCEGTGTNVFLVERGRVITPPLSAGCLPGVTRAVALEACRGAGLEAVEENRPVEALARAGEAFLSSTIREIQPIRMVDGAPLPAAPGPVTEHVAEAFRALVAANPDP